MKCRERTTVIVIVTRLTQYIIFNILIPTLCIQIIFMNTTTQGWIYIGMWGPLGCSPLNPSLNPALLLHLQKVRVSVKSAFMIPLRITTLYTVDSYYFERRYLKFFRDFELQ